MKKIILPLLFCLPTLAIAQWTTVGSNTTTTNYVGIGTTSPVARLHIAEGIGGEQLTFTRGTGVMRFLQDPNKNNLYIVDNSKTFMFLKETGDIAIGGGMPYLKLHVFGTATGVSAFTTTQTGNTSNVSVVNGSNYNYGMLGVVSGTGTQYNDIFGLGYGTSALNPFNPVITWSSAGNAGIGTVSPSSRLHIADGLGGEQVKIARGTGAVRLLQDINKDNLYLVNTAGAPLTFWKENGNVGIGSANPDEKLTVKGKIHAEEVRVDLLVPGPDYVFAPGYDLPSLEQVKAYIEKNHHLPEVPSAKEMETNGVQVGEMNMLLLKKIEELTLYVLDLKKENEDQQLKNVVMQKEIDALKAKLK